MVVLLLLIIKSLRVDFRISRDDPDGRRITDTVTQTNSLVVRTVLSRHWRKRYRILTPGVHFATQTPVASPFHGVLLSKNSFAICANDHDKRSNSHRGNIREPAFVLNRRTNRASCVFPGRTNHSANVPSVTLYVTISLAITRMIQRYIPRTRLSPHLLLLLTEQTSTRLI
jgi:hypothetical protein